MTTHLLAAELAALVPDMAKDSVTNNEALIQRKLDEFLKQTEQQKHDQ